MEGSRVRLRRARATDGPALFAVAHDRQVMLYMDWPMPRDASETTSHLHRMAESWDRRAEFQWVILDASGQLVGTISCRPQDHAADFGYFLARSHWGRGFAAEAATLVLNWLWLQPQIVRVWATADAENARSRRLLERLGLRLEGVLRMATMRPNLGGPPRDTALYARCRGDARSE